MKDKLIKALESDNQKIVVDYKDHTIGHLNHKEVINGELQTALPPLVKEGVSDGEISGDKLIHPRGPVITIVSR